MSESRLLPSCVYMYTRIIVYMYKCNRKLHFFLTIFNIFCKIMCDVMNPRGYVGYVRAAYLISVRCADSVQTTADASTAIK